MKKAQQKVQWIFVREKKIRLAIEDARCGFAPSHNGGSSSSISDPTGQAAVRNITGVKEIMVDGRIIHYPELWLRIIKETYLLLPKNCRAQFRSRIRGENYAKACERLHISQTQYYQDYRSGINIAVALGCQYGLIKLV